MYNAIIRLRRDNDFNYAKIADKFIPKKGELCLVDTANAGLRIICGDGQSTFNQLDYVDGILEKGYFYNGNFYQDQTHNNIILKSEKKLYLDLSSYSFYIVQENDYLNIQSKIPTASEKQPGIMKLYQTTGNNTDGTMSQKAITNELGEKIEMALYPEEEMLILDYNL